MVDTAMTHFDMDAGTSIPGRGKASYCQASDHHQPVPIRFVWHHVLPLSCGGRSTKDNLVQCCDSCHYAIHRLMVDLLDNDGVFVEFKRFARSTRATWAMAGYELSVSAGTQANLPRETGVVSNSKDDLYVELAENVPVWVAEFNEDGSPLMHDDIVPTQPKSHIEWVTKQRLVTPWVEIGERRRDLNARNRPQPEG